MTAYSFHIRFVDRIRAGLLSDEEWRRRSGTTAVLADVPQKRQTIRAERKNGHSRPGGDLQLYYHQRHKDGFLIGYARCVSTTPITLKFGKVDLVQDDQCLITGARGLDDFAIKDGFCDWADMRQFWAENHPGSMRGAGSLEWTGRLIRWEPFED